MRLATFFLAFSFSAAAAGFALGAAPMGGTTGTVGGSGGVLAQTGGGSKGASGQAPRPVGFTPLTSAECEGLGGTVVPTLSFKSGLFACSTVDPNGVVRTVCLTK